jgi:lipopolysaccharide transport system ATP-binding protein
MNQSIITCDRISKQYKLGASVHKAAWLANSTSLSEAVASVVRSSMSMFKGARRTNHSEVQPFWALKDVCFEVKRGEVVGIVGGNGAGKSTLLKILSRIVEPTEGIARIRGRMVSLLEVGTGFHPELSGRENVYLNGAILGMRKAEIDRKIDEIVAFSEIEQFLDTPVKRYSSGMYVRLAFAVAAHLEPEILIVDEVLAVGDLAFQKKCLGKMHDVAAGGGRTILFVSHNMSALSQLCDRGILLEKGLVTAIGPVKEVIETYLKSGLDYSTAQAQFPTDHRKPCQYVSAEILHGDDSLGSDFSCDEPVTIRVRFEIRERVPSLFLTLFLQNFDGTRVLFSDIRDTDESVHQRLGLGLHTFKITIPPRLLAPASYLLTINSEVQFIGGVDRRDNCCQFSLRDLSTRLLAPGRSSVLGVLLPWEHRQSALSPMPAANDVRT